MKAGGWATNAEWERGDSRPENKMPSCVPHNAVLVGICNAMGFPVETFGDPQYGKRELPGMRG